VTYLAHAIALSGHHLRRTDDFLVNAYALIDVYSFVEYLGQKWAFLSAVKPVIMSYFIYILQGYHEEEVNKGPSTIGHGQSNISQHSPLSTLNKLGNPLFSTLRSGTQNFP
jgi:hypothetical protein